jgi:hypothetical protein
MKELPETIVLLPYHAHETVVRKTQSRQAAVTLGIVAHPKAEKFAAR